MQNAGCDISNARNNSSPEGAAERSPGRSPDAARRKDGPRGRHNNKSNKLPKGATELPVSEIPLSIQAQCGKPGKQTLSPLLNPQNVHVNPPSTTSTCPVM